MEAGSSALIEAVSVLVPPACREHVIGDLCEQYKSRRDFLCAVATTVPFVLWSQICRTSGTPLLLGEGGALAVSFLSAAAQFGDQSFFSGTSGWFRLGMPCAAALLVIVLRDAYASEPSRPLLARAFDVVPAVAVGLVLEATLAIVGSTLALPRFITIAAAALSMFTLSTARLTFPPPRHGMPPGSTPA